MMPHRRSWKRSARRAAALVRTHGITALAPHILAALRRVLSPPSYRRWIARYDTLTAADRALIAERVAALPAPPRVSLLMPEYGSPQQTGDTVGSLLNQLYPGWQLCIGFDASVLESASEADRAALQDNRIKLVPARSPSGWADRVSRLLAAAEGDFIALVDSGDTLTPDALYWAIEGAAGADLVFSDEDTLTAAGTRERPWFKSDWNPALMSSCNAFGRLGLFRRTLVERLGGFRAGFDGAEEYELTLRCARAVSPERIRHVSRILYHRAAGSAARVLASADEAAGLAVAEHLSAQSIAATVGQDRNGLRINYAAPEPAPWVSVVIATTAEPDVVKPCFTSLLELSSYPDFEVIILVSESHAEYAARATILQQAAADARVRIVTYPDAPFNYSDVNNQGAAQATGSLLCFLNDDTQIITPDWLEQLVARVSLPGVAAAGPLLLYPDGLIQHAGVILGLSGIAGHACLYQPRESSGYFGRANRDHDVSCVSAACMLIRADAFGAAGGFDPALPVAYNDVDLCLKIREAGQRIVWTPRAELVHRESATLGWHDAGANAPRFVQARTLMQARWGAKLLCDPFYNRNLSLDRGYELAFPPRT